VPYADFTAAPSDAVRRAVWRAAEMGAHPVIATGRSLHSTDGVFRALGMEAGYAVCSNGAVVVDLARREPIHVETFDAAAAVEYFHGAVPEAILAVEEVGHGFRISGENVYLEFDGNVTTVPADELVRGPVTRLVVRWHEGDRDELRAMAAEMGLPSVDYEIGYTAWLDIMPAGVSKATGLSFVAEELGLAPRDVIAFGDGHNDMAMLQWAGHGVAMENGHRDVQAVADEVGPSVEADGVARVLARYFGP
jgi:Cof subfamily protein (haloacid dehalogenase superfamily)